MAFQTIGFGTDKRARDGARRCCIGAAVLEDARHALFRFGDGKDVRHYLRLSFSARRTLRAVTAWGRFAELFAYDDDSEGFSLENPT